MADLPGAGGKDGQDVSGRRPQPDGLILAGVELQRSRRSGGPAGAGWEWPALQLPHGGPITRQVVLEAVALLPPALLQAADEGLLGIGAFAEHDVEEVVRPSDDVGAHGPGSAPGRRFLNAHGGEDRVDQGGRADQQPDRPKRPQRRGG